MTRVYGIRVLTGTQYIGVLTEQYFNNMETPPWYYKFLQYDPITNCDLDIDYSTLTKLEQLFLKFHRRIVVVYKKHNLDHSIPWWKHDTKLFKFVSIIEQEFESYN